MRKAADDTGIPVAVLVDLQGPKIRLGKFADGPHDLAVGDILTITTEDVLGTKDLVGTTFKGLPQDVAPGDFLLIDDGKVKVEVVSTDGVRSSPAVSSRARSRTTRASTCPASRSTFPRCRRRTRTTSAGDSSSVPTTSPSPSCGNAADVDRVFEIMAEEGRKVPVIAKIEKPQAVDALEEIIDAFDGIMVARGDLGVELPLEAVPIVQKRAVELARRMAKPVIVATQMLESMISSPVPTRAETSDVANAVLDGADAVMLSGETSVGEYPVVTVQTMARIVTSTEDHGLERIPRSGPSRARRAARSLSPLPRSPISSTPSTCASSQSRATLPAACRGLRFRIPMKAFTPDAAIQRRMALTWGIESFLVDRVTHTDAMYEQVDAKLIEAGLAEVGDKVVVISGSPPGIPGSTNDLRVHVIGDAMNAAAPVWESGEHAD